MQEKSCGEKIMNYRSIRETMTTYMYIRTGLVPEGPNYSYTTCSPKLILNSERHSNCVQSMLQTTLSRDKRRGHGV